MSFLNTISEKNGFLHLCKKKKVEGTSVVVRVPTIWTLMGSLGNDQKMDATLHNQERPF